MTTITTTAPAVDNFHETHAATGARLTVPPSDTKPRISWRLTALIPHHIRQSIPPVMTLYVRRWRFGFRPRWAVPTA